LTPMLRDLTEASDKHVEILNQCAHWVDKGLLKPHISRQFSLKDVAEAHNLIETGHTSGKIVLSV
jgi:NADPH2:quinone reductase